MRGTVRTMAALIMLGGGVAAVSPAAGAERAGLEAAREFYSRPDRRLIVAAGLERARIFWPEVRPAAEAAGVPEALARLRASAWRLDSGVRARLGAATRFFHACSAAAADMPAVTGSFGATTAVPRVQRGAPSVRPGAHVEERLSDFAARVGGEGGLEWWTDGRW